MTEGISVHVISDRSNNNPRFQVLLGREPIRLSPVVAILVMIALLTAALMPVQFYLGPVNIAMLYLLPILISAVAWGPVSAVIAAILGILCFDFFFVPPLYGFAVTDVRYLISFAIFLVVALLTGQISARLRQHITNARQREARMAALYALSREIAATNELEKVLEQVARKVYESVESQVVILLPNEENKLVVRAKSDGNQDILADDNERAVAIWVYEHGQTAGRGTDTLAGADCTYVPMRTEQGILGVLGIRPQDSRHLLPEQRRLLDALASLAAVAVNRIQLVEQAKKVQVLAESGRLHTALFNSISHELRTPLTTIIGSVTGLLDEDDIYDPAARRGLLQTIRQSALRMNRLVTNLLDMARLESGFVHLNRERCEIQDVIGVSVSRVETLGKRPLKIDIEPNLPMVAIDFVLIEQVLVNLLDNAAKYSEPDYEIAIRARWKKKFLQVDIEDRGPGIPVEDLELVFDKFYRLKRSNQIGGTGLGLTICKSIIEAHGGKIWAVNNSNGGAVFSFVLPLGYETRKTAVEASGGDEIGKQDQNSDHR
jgi:two-component system sensor histidine kinase KdpD